MAVVTITGSSVTGGGDPSGAAGGALAGTYPNPTLANLTTVGRVPYISSSGILNRSSAVFWDSANTRLGVGTDTPLYLFHVARGSDNIMALFSGLTRALRISTTASDVTVTATDSTGAASFEPLLINSSRTIFSLSSVEQARFAATTGNFLIGVATEQNFKIAVAKSGSSGTALFKDLTASTGTTKVVVGAGAGQSGSMMEWQDNAGVVQSSVSSTGRFVMRSNQFTGVLAAALPAAAAGNAGQVQYVTDALAPTVGVVVTGGGAVPVLAWSDGTIWKVMAV